jgi:arginine deiminase
MNTLLTKPISFGVYSEVGQLNAVLLHRPGDELKRLTIHNHKTFLFDSIPCLTEAQKSHDLFAKYLTDNHIQVFYVRNLLYETLEQSSEARHALIQDLLDNSNKTELKRNFKN